MTRIAEKRCLECGERFNGREDKKFCSDACRITYNNRQNSDATNYVKNINNTLRRNRRILLGLNPDGKAKVHRDKLQAKGFDFNYYTSIYTTKSGSQYHYCYEQGYLAMDQNFFLLVRKTGVGEN